MAVRSINNIRYADDTALMVETEERLKNLLKNMKEESEKNWLETQHSNNRTSDPITSWQIDGETMERNSDRLFFFGLQNHCPW